MKVIGIIKDDCITGVQYGVIEIPDPEIKKLVHSQETLRNIQKIKAKKFRAENTKHK